MKKDIQLPNFEAAFKVTKVEPTIDACRSNNTDFTSLLKNYGGSTFDNGLYRIHNSNSYLLWNRIVENCFPNYSGKIDCFGFDWYGRQYAIDKNNKSTLYMFDCAAFEDYKLKNSLQSFHNNLLVDTKCDTLLEDEFLEWMHIESKLLNFDQCVGFKIPLFMGGEESVDNLEIYNMKFYWELNQQLYNSNN